MKYADARWRAIDRGEGCLLLEEMAAGWHFCNEFDLELQDVEADGACRWCGFSAAVAASMNLDTWRRWLLIALLERPALPELK